MTRFLPTFTTMTLFPAGLLIWASVYGGFWPLAPLVYLTALNHAVDAVLSDQEDTGIEHALKTILPITLGLLHFVLMAVAIWALAIKPAFWWEKTPLFIAYAFFFASVSNANAHELIHRTARFPFELGKWIFISHLFGHHTSSHRLVHHPYVATRFDPNTARYNESFYRFFVRAWKGSLLMGLAAENTRRGLPETSRKIDLGNPYFTYVAGAGLFAAIALGFAGIHGFLVYLGLAFFAQASLLMTDYVQHYGLLRQQHADGRFEPTMPKHSWNAPQWFTRILTLNAPRHSDHHAKPGKPFTELKNIGPNEAPQLPYSTSVMATIALHPRRWRALMNPKVQEIHLRERTPT